MSSLSTWEFLLQREVRNEKKINLPKPVRETVVEDHLTKNASIHWSIENDNRFVVLSKSPLENNKTYANIGFYQVYGIESPDEDGGRIRPPAEITDIWTGNPQPGDRVFFLTHERMRHAETPSVYLLSEPQVLKLLPSRPGRTRPQQQSFTDSLFEVPGFGSRR